MQSELVLALRKGLESRGERRRRFLTHRHDLRVLPVLLTQISDARQDLQRQHSRLDQVGEIPLVRVGNQVLLPALHPCKRTGVDDQVHADLFKALAVACRED